MVFDETRLRSFIKITTTSLVCTTTTAICVWVTTGQLFRAVASAIVIEFIDYLTLLLLERAWNRVSCGWRLKSH